MDIPDVSTLVTELTSSSTEVMAMKTYSSVSGRLSSEMERLNDLISSPSANSSMPDVKV